VQIEERFLIAAPVERVWAFLLDTEAVAACVPGCEAVACSGENSYTARMKVKVGPVSANFDVQIDVTEMTSGAMWLADPDGSHPRKLGRSCCWMSQMDPEALWPMWSPDGSLIAYQPLYQSPIRFVDVRSGQVQKLGEGDDPSWLDDHTLIITDFKEIKS
jgi:hypothetical protein